MHVYKAKEFAIASTAKDFLGEAHNDQCFSMFQASDLLTAEGLLPVTLHVRAGICVRCGGGLGGLGLSSQLHSCVTLSKSLHLAGWLSHHTGK